MKFKTVLQLSLARLVEERQTLLRVLVLPFFALLILKLLFLLAIPSATKTFLMYVADLALYTLFAVTTHRIVLIGADSVPDWGITSWKKRETIFLLTYVGITLMAAPFLVITLIPLPYATGIIFAAFLALWIFGRLSLALPSIAIEKAMTLQEAWNASRNHQLLMFLVVLIYPFTTALVNLLLQPLANNSFIFSAISACLIVFEVATLSAAYHMVVAQPNKSRIEDNENY